MNGYIYPDGGPILDQPLKLLDAFSVIADARTYKEDDEA